MLWSVSLTEMQLGESMLVPAVSLEGSNMVVGSQAGCMLTEAAMTAAPAASLRDAASPGETIGVVEDSSSSPSCWHSHSCNWGNTSVPTRLPVGKEQRIKSHTCENALAHLGLQHAGATSRANQHGNRPSCDLCNIIDSIISGLRF